MQEMERSGRMLTYIEACAQEYRAKLRAEAVPRPVPKVCKIKGSVFAAKPSENSGPPLRPTWRRRIEGINDSAPLWEIGDLIIDCSDAGEFVKRLREIG